MFLHKFPVIELSKVTLREIDYNKDYKVFYNYIQDKKVNRFISEEDIPKNENEAKLELEYWQSLFPKGRSIYWAIALTQTDKIIGTCGFNMISKVHRRGEISYDLAHPYWGKGIMTECLRSILNHGFSLFNLNRVQATVALDNYGSIRVLEKLGFEKEGILKSYGILHGVKKDFYMTSIRGDELISRK